MNETNEPDQRGTAASTTAAALEAAGDNLSARDIGALDNAAAAVDRKLAPSRTGLVERLIYGPQPDPGELRSGGRVARRLGNVRQPVLETALASLAAGEAFTADGRLTEAIREAVAGERAYGFTVPVTHGGAGGAYVELAGIEESLAANGLGPLAVEISGQLTIGAGSILAYGSDEQRTTFLPLIADGNLMGFALTEVGVGVNAKKIQAWVETDDLGNYRLFADGARNKLWITNARHDGLLGIAARIGKDGDQIGLFVLRIPDTDVSVDSHGYEFRCEPSGVAAFTANYNSRLHFRNFPIPKANRIPADGVEVLFYCLRMGRCMLAAMSAGYQRMLARDASNYARQRAGVGGPVFRHELPRLAIGRMLGGSLQSRALAYLSLQQDATGVDLAGLRDLTKSAAASAGVESMIACEHVMGGRSFDSGSRVNAARVNLHLFSVVEGEDDLIRLGMVRDVTQRFVSEYLGALLETIQAVNVDSSGKALPTEQRLLAIGLQSFLKHPDRSFTALSRVLRHRAFWKLGGWVLRNAGLDLLRLLLVPVPSVLMPRYSPLPAGLRRYARFAERRLRALRWRYLAVSLFYQLELTRAQIPLQRLGLCIEYLVSMVVICYHAAEQDESQQRIAAIQAQLLKDKYHGVRLIGSLRDLERLRKATAAMAADIEGDSLSLFSDLEPEPFAHPWQEDSDE
ncbi:MAG: acyl-CoA dehydrogenase family protein [Gammaproteobacteria bacterium]